jgi:hypothetical protein
LLRKFEFSILMFEFNWPLQTTAPPYIESAFKKEQLSIWISSL